MYHASPLNEHTRGEMCCAVAPSPRHAPLLVTERWLAHRLGDQPLHWPYNLLRTQNACAGRRTSSHGPDTRSDTGHGPVPHMLRDSAGRVCMGTRVSATIHTRHQAPTHVPIHSHAVNAAAIACIQSCNCTHTHTHARARARAQDQRTVSHSTSVLCQNNNMPRGKGSVSSCAVMTRSRVLVLAYQPHAVGTAHAYTTPKLRHIRRRHSVRGWNARLGVALER